MTSHVPLARVPFAPLDNPRLQHLASAKNRQNGAIPQPAGKSSLLGKTSLSPSSKSIFISSKRSFEPSISSDFDSENVDPATSNSPPKKSKSEMPFDFTLATPIRSSMAPPPTIPSRLSTPMRGSMSAPRTPMTAPAGRSPIRKATGTKNRRVSAPFSRIDPPFASRGGSSMPFSLDAALNGTFASSAVDAGATIKESMPKSWMFEIYEDTAEEEAGNLMEHSTLTLDLSSDDESERKERDDRGKENVAPDDYDAPSASRAAVVDVAAAAQRLVTKAEIVRKKVASDDMDDGARSPLDDLETEAFIPEGLSKDSVIMVDGVASAKLDVGESFAVPVAPTAAPMKKQTNKKRTADAFEVEIVVWEDSGSVFEAAPVGNEADGVKKGAAADENTMPAVDQVA